MKNFYHCLLLLLLGCLLTACDKEVFEPDTGDGRLPKYTEKGNNIAGALVNDVAWKSEYQRWGLQGTTGPLSIRSYKEQNDSLVLFMNGIFNEKIYQGKVANIIFIFDNAAQAGLPTSDNTDYTQWQGKRVSLDGNANFAYIEAYNDSLNCSSKGKGEIYFQRVQRKENKNGDRTTVYYILSGTFEFTIENDCIKSRVTKGRFDFRL